jgi:hypothetical protein
MRGMMFSPQWHAIDREGQLAAEQLASGVTILGRANHGLKGLYTQAFFALSIGIERLARAQSLAPRRHYRRGYGQRGHRRR